MGYKPSMKKAIPLKMRKRKTVVKIWSALNSRSRMGRKVVKVKGTMRRRMSDFRLLNIKFSLKIVY